LSRVKEVSLRLPPTADGDFTIARPACFGDAAEIGPVDWVICALKATAIDQAPRRGALRELAGGS
jgi:hypothetical protein